MSARLAARLRGMLCSVGALFRAPYSGADAESRPVLRGNTGLPPMAVFVLGASAAVLTLWLCGVL